MFLLASCATQEQSANTGTDTTSKSVDTSGSSLQPGPLTGTLHNYYELKDAFAKADGTGADMAAIQLRLNIDSLDAGKLNVDSAMTDRITKFKKNMLAAIDSLIKVRVMPSKKQQFQTLSSALYQLIKSAPYPGESIYWLHCAQVDPNGADWMSSTAISTGNPYDTKLPECGTATDSITR